MPGDRRTKTNTRQGLHAAMRPCVCAYVCAAWGNLANVLNADGRSLAAEHAYKVALQHRSNMADVHYNL